MMEIFLPAGGHVEEQTEQKTTPFYFECVQTLFHFKSRNCVTKHILALLYKQETETERFHMTC